MTMQQANGTIKYADQGQFMREIEKAYKPAQKSIPNRAGLQVIDLFSAAADQAKGKHFEFHYRFGDSEVRIQCMQDSDGCVYIDRTAIQNFIPADLGTESQVTPKKHSIAKRPAQAHPSPYGPWLTVNQAIQKVIAKNPELMAGQSVVHSVSRMLQTAFVKGMQHTIDGVGCRQCKIGDESMFLAVNYRFIPIVHEEGVPQIERILRQLQPDIDHEQAAAEGRRNHLLKKTMYSGAMGMEPGWTFGR